ncbi:MAG: GNAT family N-acetyltransferase [Gammaproteobacteria bacterium]|nr:GNAT family N-acetyltransferase [Gammaproteobacteria bacterium]
MTTSISYDSTLTVSLQSVDDAAAALVQVAMLEKFSRSIFTTRPWLAAWLQTLGDKAEIYILQFYTRQNKLVGLCFMTRATIRRRNFFQIEQLSLNESEVKDNKFIIEYNGILHDPDYRDDVHYAFIEFLGCAGLKFDELRINAAEAEAFHHLKKYCSGFDLHFIEDETSKAYYTDLNGYDGDPGSYLAALSKSRREQIRRSIKYFSQFGEPVLEFASGSEEYLEFFHQLGELHQRVWTSRGRAGAYASQNWVDFHRRLITDYPDRVQLIRISYGSHVLGYLYNLIDGKAAYSIQSGFNYSADKNDRPGIVAHFMVTNDYIKGAMQRYEYLAGESQYKCSLSNAHRQFSWYRVQKRNLKMRIENTAVWLKRAVTNKWPYS